MGENWPDVGEEVGRDDSNCKLLLYSKPYPRRILVSLRLSNRFLFILLSKVVTLLPNVLFVILMVSASIKWLFEMFNMIVIIYHNPICLWKYLDDACDIMVDNFFSLETFFELKFFKFCVMKRSYAFLVWRDHVCPWN